MKQNIFPILLWIFTPVLTFCFLNSMADRQDNWLKAVMRASAQQKIDAIFIGSSRVRAAIDVDAFNAEIKNVMGKSPVVLKISHGFTTEKEIYFFFERVAAKWPKILNPCVIFIEAPMGVPYLSTWNERWVAPDYPLYIAPYLSLNAITFMWQTKLSTAEKVLLTRIWCIKNIALFAYQGEFREQILQGGTAWIQGLLKKFIEGDPAKVLPWTFDNERKLAITLAARSKVGQTPVWSWDRTTLADLVRLVHRNGGQVIFYRMPLSSVQAAVYDTPVRKKDRENFYERAQNWGTPVLDNGIQVTDNDFPDLWHLSRSRAAEFSKDVAQKFIQTDYFQNNFLARFKGE